MGPKRDYRAPILAVLLGCCGTASAQNGQRPGFRPPSVTASFWRASLHELLAANYDAAIAAYRDVVSRQRDRERAHTLALLAELHLLRGDAVGLRRDLDQLGQLAEVEVPTIVLEDPLGHDAEALRESMAPVWRLVAELDRPRGPERPPEPGEREAAVSAMARLRIPLGSAVPILLRRRAGEIAELRLDGNHDRADRLERDIVARLRESEQIQYLERQRAFEAPAAAEMPYDRIRTDIEATRRDALSTASERRILDRVRDALDEAEARGGAAAALEVWDRLPFASAAGR